MGGVKYISNYSTYLLKFSDHNLFNEENLEKTLQLLHLNKLKLKININSNAQGIKVYLSFDKKDLHKIKNIFKTFLIDVFFEEIKIEDNLDYRSYGLKKHFSIPIKFDGLNSNEILYKKTLSFKSYEYLSFSIDLKPYQSIRIYFLRKEIIAGKKIHLRIFNPFIFPSTIFFYVDKSINTLLNKSSRRYLNNKNDVDKLDKLFSNLFKVDFKISSNKEDIIEEYINNINSHSIQKLSSSKMHKVNSIFSSKEISSILNIPGNEEIAVKENIEKIKHFEPSSNLTKSNVIKLGTNYKNQNRNISLEQSAREKHLLILGSTGAGKSTLLKNMINQDIEKHRGLTLIDPHGDLAKDIRIKNRGVLYLDPIKSNIRINLLERKFTHTDFRYKLETEKITENVISVLSKLFSKDDEMGHKIEFVLRNACYLALEKDNANLYTIYKILLDQDYRNELVNNSSNIVLKNYWKNEFNKSGDYQRVKMISGITSKIGRLINSPLLGSIFNSYKSNINFEDVILNKKVLICNLSKGDIGEHTSSLLGSLIIAKLQLAAYSMSAFNESSRVDHYLYIDESQNFAGNTLKELISEARKYHLYLNLAQQSLAQQDDSFNQILLSNVGNVITFRSSSPKDSSQLSKLFGSINDRHLLDLPSYNFYLRNVTGISPVVVNGRVVN
jgi:energy-coupling factor transporter ATP-binding protein EcfA2